MLDFITERIYELTALVAYLAILLWIGVRSVKQIQTSTEYTLAGRNVPWTILLATTAATMIGGGASVGMVSRVAQVGIAAALVTCGWHLQLLLTGLFVAPRLRGLPLLTVGDYFHMKFGALARQLAVVNCVIFLIGVLVAQMAAIGTVTNAILGIPYSVGLWIGAVVTVFYSTVGGMRAVVKTDVLQFVVLVVGIGAAAAVLFVRQGGFAEMSQRAHAGQFEITGHWSGMYVFSLFVTYMLGESLVPPYTVRCFIAQDAEQARWGIAGAGIFLLLFLPLATFILGTCAQVSPEVQQTLQEQTAQMVSSTGIDQDTAQERASQLAFPTLVRTAFHPIFAGIVVAAIIAAVMSSADSSLSCLSTVVMEDLYRRHWNLDASDRQLLRVAQSTTLVTGVITAVLAWRFQNIAQILEFVYDFWAPAMIVPFLVGVFWYRENRIYAAVFAMIAGMTAAAVWRFVVQKPFPGDVSPTPFGFAVSLVVLFVALPVTRSWSLRSWFVPGTTNGESGDGNLETVSS
ncbi:MAG: sodium:solute symporter family protein [Pirellulaceae bacterium]|nr:sodium:solute symporter family protein [Pirellulaceae bacterium]